MPLAFPSHQGLVAPLWRRWPDRFDAVALCVGAAAPDVVDGILVPIVRGHLGQWIGHSLVGLFLLCWPVTLIILLAARRLRPRPAIVATSALLGAFSHLVFDFVSHDSFLWLYPWLEPKGFFPAWWRESWFAIPLPFYPRPYPVGPHLLVWTALSVTGAVMFLRKPGPASAGTRAAPVPGTR